MGKGRFLSGIIGIALVVLPLVFPSLLPAGSVIGVDILSNNTLSIIIGAFILVFVFMSWNKARKMKNAFGGNFTGPSGSGDVRKMKAINDAQIKAMQDVQRLRALQGA